MKNGILIINKPQGITSFSVVSKVRKILNIKRIGHTGTLDPLATGVLVLLIGAATKFQIFMQDHNKKYVARIKFGITTDTQDITGKILSEKSNFNVSFEQFESTIQQFKGPIMQVPPMFSAIKRNGQRLYRLARKGITVDREARETFVNKIKILEFNKKDKFADIEISCSKGTYVRTLCDDIGKKLGCGATMVKLNRIECNGFKISESSDIENVNEKKILPIESMFKELDSIKVTQNQAKRFRNGGNLFLDRLQENSKYFTENDDKILKLYSQNDDFIGLGKINAKNFQLEFLKSI